MKAQNFFNSIFPKKILSNTIFLLFERVFGLLLNLIVSIYVARYLAPEKYGILNYTLSLVILIIPLSKIAYDTIIVRELVNQKSSQNTIMGSAFVLRTLGGLFCWFIILIINNLWINEKTEYYALFIMSLMTFSQGFYVIDFYFQSQINSRFIVYSKSIAILSAAIWSLSMIFVEAELIYFAIAYLIQEVILVSGLIFFFQRQTGQFFQWNFNRQIAKQQFRSSLPLIFSLVVIGINLKIDQVLIEIFLDHESVGKYAAAARISEAWYFVPAALLSSYFPEIVKQIKNHNLVRGKIINLCTLLFYTAFGVALFTTLAADFLVSLIFGKAYIAGASVLKIHIWAGVFIFIGIPISKVLIAKKLEIYHVYGKSLAALLNIILNIIFIPAYGIQGAAWSTLISYAIGSFFSFALFSQSRVFFWWQCKGIFKPFLIGIKALKK